MIPDLINVRVRLSASAKVGSLRDPPSQRWLGGPPLGRTAVADKKPETTCVGLR
jgi:hypothetical protein